MAGVRPLLQVQQLRKVYRTTSRGEFVAVDGISFEIPHSECFGLLGPNGAGKSTTIQCITGFYPATSGTIVINGIDVHENPREARQVLGFCSQDDTLDTDFKALDQLIRHATYFRIPPKKGRARALDLLRQFGLEDKATQQVESLSGGMKRRLQVARAFISDPKFVILDEPTTGLDPEARRQLWDVLVAARARGVAILLSTHYMDEAERLCDRIAIIHRGKFLDVDSPSGLIAKHVGTSMVEEEIRPGVIWKRPPNLEDVYLKLTGTSLKEEAP